MNTAARCVFGAVLALSSYTAAAADAQGIRHEIEVFLSSGVGSIVSIVLLILFMLWLLLPLAVFGLKSRLKALARENRETNRMLAEIKDVTMVSSQIEETNRILADIREELSALSEEEEAPPVKAERSEVNIYEEDTADLYDEIKYDP